MPAWTDDPAADAEAYAVYLEEDKEEKYDRLAEDEFILKSRKGNMR